MTRRIMLGLIGIGLGVLGVLALGIEHPALRAFVGVDFFDYYYAARALWAGHSPYEPAWADALALAERQPVLPGSHYIYPPWFAGALLPLAALPARWAAGAWWALNGALWLGLLHRARDLGPCALGLAAGFAPLLFTFMVGQSNLLLLALLAAGLSLVDRRPAWAGVALGVATALKVGPGLILVGLAVQRRGRLIGAAVLTVGALIGVGELLVPGGTAAWLQVLAQVAEPGLRHAHPVNQGLPALVDRLCAPSPWSVGPLDCAGAASLSRDLTAVAALIAVAWAGWRGNAARIFAVGIVGFLLSSPLAWEASFVLLLLPMAHLWRRGRRATVGLIWGLFWIQRALDGYANDPAAWPTLRALPWLAAWGTLATAVLAVAVWMGERDPPTDTAQVAQQA